MKPKRDPCAECGSIGTNHKKGCSQYALPDEYEVWPRTWKRPDTGYIFILDRIGGKVVRIPTGTKLSGVASAMLERHKRGENINPSRILFPDVVEQYLEKGTAHLTEDVLKRYKDVL